MVAGRPETRPWRRGIRWSLAVAAGVLALVALAGMRVNVAIADSGNSTVAGSFRTAVAQAGTATGWAPWMKQGWVSLGVAQLGEGDRSAAAPSFRRATAESPNDWRAWFDLALATGGAERIAALGRAQALNPRDPAVTALTARLNWTAARPARVRRT